MYSSSSSPNKFVDDLPKANFMQTWELCEWEGFWLAPVLVEAAVSFRTSFDAKNDDVFLASSLKTGTTWLKALLFCIMQRQQNHQALDTAVNHDALTLKSPHSLVPTIEAIAYMKKAEAVDASGPRLLHTHLPHVLLPESVKNSACKMVYVARNPKDTVISSWHFHNSLMRPEKEAFQLEKFVDDFCSGLHPYGPFVEHVAAYWEESRKMPDKILFVKYEELKDDPKRQVMKIAEFLEMPFGDEDEGGAVEEIVRRCSLERLKNLEVNKRSGPGPHCLVAPNNSFFRKGEVGDWKNYLTPEMEMQIDHTISLKFQELGLYF